ncbi:MAG: alpha/beta fold hydrolase [Bacteroidota bacterium]
MKILKRSLILLFVLIIGGYFYLALSLADRILVTGSSLELTKARIANGWGTTFDTMLALLPEGRAFEVTSFDDTILKGKYFQKADTANCAVIMLHGWSDTWAGMLKYVPVLEDCHCDLVFYDHRAHGESGGEYPTGGINESKDLLAVTEWLQSEKEFTPNQIGWFGASWGGAAVLQAGASDKDVAFIIADAPFQDWYSAIFERATREMGVMATIMSFGVMKTVNWKTGINYKNASARQSAKLISEPLLLIHSKTDSFTGSEQSVNIAKGVVGDNCTFHHLDWGGDHTEDVLINTDAFKGLINDFLQTVNEEFLKQ